MTYRTTSSLSAVTILSLLLTACGGGGGDTPPVSTPPPVPVTGLSGVFIDTSVSGLGYSTATFSAVTNAAGNFTYMEGETVRFFLGPLVLGEAQGAALISPLDLAQSSSGITDSRVLAMASFLQTGDQDGDLANGIQLLPELGELLCAELGIASFDISTATDLSAFQTSLQAVATAQGLAYVAPATAGSHLSSSLMARMEQLAAFDPGWGTAGVFTGEQQCEQCHQAQTGDTTMRLPQDDATGEDISPPTEWQHSVMAHAFDDPYFQAVLQEETVHEFPDFTGFIEDRCLTCHSPMGRTHAHKTLTGLDDDGFYRIDQALVDQHAREGVSCTLCHQVAATDVNTEGDPVVGDDTFSGNYVIEDSRTIYGPYDSVNQRPMLNQTNYTPQYGHQVTESDYCATCHTVRTPVMDVNTGQLKVPASEFLEQSPYLEWENSAFSQSVDPAQRRECQDCHMPIPSETYQTRIVVQPPNQAMRQPFHQHKFYGGNTYILELLKTFRSVLGIENSVSEGGFDAKILATRSFLEQQAVTVSIERMEAVAGNLEVDVMLTNLSGHKLPSAYPSRRAWLHFVVKDGSGSAFFESGAPANDGRISIDAAAVAEDCLAIIKPAGFTNCGCIEPHRDLIENPAQVAVYESVLADTNGHVNHVLLYADHYAKDNRLPPRGFRQADAAAGTAIELGGVTDNDFNSEGAEGGSGADTVHYRVPVSDRTGPFTVEVKLLYQTVRPSFVAGLHGDSSRVARFKTMYKMLPPTVEKLGSVTQTQ